MSEDPADVVADELRRRGLAAPARLLLDAHLPLAPLLDDAAAALSPLLGVVAGRSATGLRRLVDEGSGMERVLRALDVASERDAKPR